MKKSTKVTLTLVATLGLAACNRQRRDPCESATFNEQACQDAVQNRGYYWNGGWVPMTYGYPYPYYYDSYRSYTAKGVLRLARRYPRRLRIDWRRRGRSGGIRCDA
jgi:hypothetical protein